MKQRTLWGGIIGLLLFGTILGFLRVNFSSAQTASSSPSSTPTLVVTSSDVALSSTSTTIAQPAPSSTSSTSSTGMAAPLVTSTSNVTSSIPPTISVGTSTVSSTTAAPLTQPTSTPAAPPSSSPNLTESLLSSTSTTPSSSITLVSAPTNLAASAVSTSQIVLSWSGSTGIAGYNVYREGSFLTNVLASSSVSAGYSDIGLSASTTYVYAVAAYDASGTISALSNQASATTQSVPPPPPIPTGYPTCDQTVKNVPGSYPNIQAAINASSFGDTVKIAAGTYNENLNLKSGICLEGAGIDQTIISKSGASGITGDGVSYAIIKNFSVKNSGCEPGSCGGGGDGGGILLTGSQNITLSSCRLTGNVAVNGGGILVSESSITVDHCLIDGNTAHNIGGGLAVELSSTVVLTNVTVANNNWSNALGNGGVGGVSSYGSSVQITNSILWGNTQQDFSGNGSSISNSDIGSWSGGASNINSNPNFVSNTDYHLQLGSPAVGMGAY